MGSNIEHQQLHMRSMSVLVLEVAAKQSLIIRKNTKMKVSEKGSITKNICKRQNYKR